MNPHSYRLKGRDFVHQGKIEIDVNERAVFIRTQGCFFVYTNSDCFLNSLWNRQSVILLLENKLITINNVGAGILLSSIGVILYRDTPISYKNPVNFFDIEETA